MFDHAAQAHSADEWLEIAAREEVAARRLGTDMVTAAAAWSHAGFAVECALKAAIMAREGMNRWPTAKERREVHVHDLAKLAVLAGAQFDPTMAVAPAWITVLKWRRQQTYNPRPMPLRVVNDMIEAAFGEDGVVPWIRSNCLRRS